MKVKKNILTILLCFLMCLSSTFTIVADDTSNNQNSVDTTPETSEATDDTGLQSEDKDSDETIITYNEDSDNGADSNSNVNSLEPVADSASIDEESDNEDVIARGVLA